MFKLAKKRGSGVARLKRSKLGRFHKKMAAMFDKTNG
jgi:hypothetical protein